MSATALRELYPVRGVSNSNLWLPENDTDPKWRMENFREGTFSSLLTIWQVSDACPEERGIERCEVPHWLPGMDGEHLFDSRKCSIPENAVRASFKS